MATVLVGLGNPTSASAQGGSGEARNVILLIGDGMGDSEITIARNYHLGAAGTLAMDTLPNTGLTPRTP
jgi:alkaline phosphatase